MRKKIKIFYAVLSIVLTSLAFTPRAEALISAFDAINFKPAISNDTDYFGIYSSQMVAKHGWNAGVYFDYARNPLEIGVPLGNRAGSVIDDTLVGNFYATYGILDIFSVGLNIPVAFYNHYFNNVATVPMTPGGFDPRFTDLTNMGNFDNQTNLGDIRLEFKIRVLDNREKLIGLSLLPFMTLPSGPSYVFMGNGTLTGGLKIILDFNIHERVKLALNVGFLARDDVQIMNVRMDDQLLLGLGLSIKIIERLTFIAEGSTEPVLRDLFENEVQTPAEVRGGFRIKATDNINFNVGGGAGLTIGVGTPDFRAFLGMNYHWTPPECPACEKPPAVEARKITISQVIHFAFDKAVIRPNSYAILDDVAAVIKANPSIKAVKVEGNTDAIGSDAYNMRLSMRRANAVKNYLVKKGIPATMLESVGYGESRPVATNATAEGRAQNRRVEFKVVD